jgi:hypothetical protein
MPFLSLNGKRVQYTAKETIEHPFRMDTEVTGYAIFHEGSRPSAHDPGEASHWEVFHVEGMTEEEKKTEMYNLICQEIELSLEENYHHPTREDMLIDERI